MRTSVLLSSVLAASFAMFAACTTATGRATSGEPDSGAENPENPNLGNQDSGTGVIGVVGSLKGTVYAPNGTLPLAGALVYLARNKPAPIATRTFCDKCVELNGADSTLTLADGTFKLDVTIPGDHFLVVQKGTFRRITPITVGSGVRDIEAALTTLPSKTEGDQTAPRMAVVSPLHDHIDKTLARLGVTQIDMIPVEEADAFVKSASLMSKYHVVFLPCGAGGEGSCNSARRESADMASAVRSYVQGGGRLYVTDFAYEYVHRTWPNQISWSTEGNWSGIDTVNHIGDACEGSWNGDAKWIDPGLKAWMAVPAVHGSGPATLEKNYTRMVKVNPVNTVDENGETKRLTPTVWAQGQYKGGAYEPTTVSFQDKCGRVLFSTYHSEAGTTLLAQEKALLYILLEVNTCVGTPVVPG